MPGVGGWTVNSVIDALAAAPTDPDTVYASAGGHIFVTTTHGLSWRQIDVPGYADHFFDLKVDPSDSRIAYAVRGLFGGGHVFQTMDGGHTWADISGNLPDLPAFTIALGADALYLGTDAGVYSSPDGGKSWSPFGEGFPDAQVRELIYDADLGVLAAGTHGRGMWEISLSKPAARAAALFLGATNGLLASVFSRVDASSPLRGYESRALTGTARADKSDRPSSSTELSPDSLDGTALRLRAYPEKGSDPLESAILAEFFTQSKGSDPGSDPFSG